ncbi:CCE_0567 family metalloprotein [Bradyrhizobium sp. IC3069]|uniref:CCE_0567 family metalloprotein n=1 Tax=unclassified Bradyrhizobium TaxID=2631580 RepID=UPI0031F64ED5|nr:hypothetical protein [Bradyrhizobium sp. IC4059]
MSDLEILKTEVRTLWAKATRAKTDLCDLLGELPANWTLIVAKAQEAHDAFSELERKRGNLEEVEEASGYPSTAFATRDGCSSTPDCLISLNQQPCNGCGRCFRICGV